MSLSNPTPKNPAVKFIDWSGSKGQFKYYDKEKEENVFFDDDIYIIPLDELSTIKGYDDDNNCGFFSNEVKYLAKEILHVRSFKGGSVAKGLYSDIKLPTGCKFAKSVYAVMITGGKENTKLELVNFQFFGSSLGSWIDARINVDSGEVLKLSSSDVSLKKGQTIYFQPGIQKMKKRQDILDKCIEIDKDLQVYLKGYLTREQTEVIVSSDAKQSEVKQTVNETVIDDFYDVDDLPF